MYNLRQSLFNINLRAALCAAVGVMSWAQCGVANETASVQEVRAASVVGTGDAAVLTLIRELSAWKDRALRAEELLSRAGVEHQATSRSAEVTNSGGIGSVLGSLEEERMLILSLGRGKGALQGALVSVGSGVIAKVVESRETVSAALVDSSYKGKLVALEGLSVKLAVR
jgi:hypothetical protein